MFSVSNNTFYLTQKRLVFKTDAKTQKKIIKQKRATNVELYQLYVVLM